ncbi:hypothetical protein KI387_037756, partial [Taxus chinensis]
QESISGILTQQNNNLMEQPITFFSQSLKDYEFKYSFIEKQVFAVIRALKKFKHMLSNNKIHLMVSHPGVKEFLLNKEMNEKHAGWITKVMEYDVHIKVTKLVRGKGLCQQLATDMESKSNEDVTLLNTDEDVDQADWLSKMKNFIFSGAYPTNMDKNQ